MFVTHPMLRGSFAALLLLGCSCGEASSAEGAPPQTGSGTTTGAGSTAGVGSTTEVLTTTGVETTEDAVTTTDASADTSSGTSTCTPLSCADEDKNCGLVPDGCRGELDCGVCEEPEICGGAGVDNVCGVACTPVAVIFFDLGDTLVEPAGGGMFMERPGAVELIADLKALPMRVGVITNTLMGWTETDLRNALVNPDFLDEFEVVLLSSQSVSPPKPDPGIFSEAYALLESPPPIEQIVFVTEELSDIANSEDAPTLGAKAAGMLGAHLSFGAPSPLADYTFAPDDLAAISDIAATEWIPCTAESVESTSQ